ncbi:hypothetical protein ALP8811_01447 [Aliiroseovarius pelagivivens]|uniref:Uncharacterized protein n=1 Tax=Aliiroseovarius pelagivivens TaxID=1639690 RepID=A0A2R8AK50_9RHOB|nr:hypothetical protein [Aliiroseovarius pelagivivens]SPF76442.1 hypothetical protein ALP8811_01447 [Aliiroseovarius pelagivivens]
MVVIVAFIVGAALGALRAKKRGGNRLDMAQYGAVHGIVLALIATFLTIVITRA